jgi:hypothetical protein
MGSLKQSVVHLAREQPFAIYQSSQLSGVRADRLVGIAKTAIDKQ